MAEGKQTMLANNKPAWYKVSTLDEYKVSFYMPKGLIVCGLPIDLLSNQSEKYIYNQNLVSVNKIQKRLLCALFYIFFNTM